MASWPYNTAAWQKLRAAKLKASPLCQHCRERGTIMPAKAVDHNTPIARGGEPFPALAGLTALCEPCHNEKTATHDRGEAKPFARRFKGFDAGGNPLDRGDAWHGGGAFNHQNEAGSRTVGDNGIYLVLGSQPVDDTNDLGFA